MAQLTVQVSSLSGTAPAFVAAAAGGDSFVNNGGTVLHVKNAGAGAITATIDSASPCSYGFDHDISVSIPAGAERIIGPFNQTRFSTTVNVTYSGVTSVTVGAFSTS